MNFKRYGQDRDNWKPEARYSVHGPDGVLSGYWGANRYDAKQSAVNNGNGHWVKDNINTYFYYGVVGGRAKRIRFGSTAHKAFMTHQKLIQE